MKFKFINTDFEFSNSFMYWIGRKLGGEGIEMISGTGEDQELFNSTTSTQGIPYIPMSEWLSGRISELSTEAKVHVAYCIMNCNYDYNLVDIAFRTIGLQSEINKKDAARFAALSKDEKNEVEYIRCTNVYQSSVEDAVNDWTDRVWGDVVPEFAHPYIDHKGVLIQLQIEGEMDSVEFHGSTYIIEFD